MRGFSSSGTRVGHVSAWLLLMRTLGAPDLVREPFWGFLRALIPCSTTPLAGAAVWIDYWGEVGVSDGMVAKALSFRGRVICRPWNDLLETKEP